MPAAELIPEEENTQEEPRVSSQEVHQASFFLGPGNHLGQRQHFRLAGIIDKFNKFLLSHLLLEKFLHLKKGKPAIQHLETGLPHILPSTVIKINLMTKTGTPDLKIFIWRY
jgi:hypothetical protein